MNTRKILFAATCVLWCGFTAFAGTPTVAPADSGRYIADVKMLASPEFEGRGAGTKGIERATKMIAQRYKSLGLQPAGTNGYLQPFTVTTGAKLKPDNHASWLAGDEKVDMPLRLEYVPFSFSSSGSVTAPLVF